MTPFKPCLLEICRIKWTTSTFASDSAHSRPPWHCDQLPPHQLRAAAMERGGGLLRLDRTGRVSIEA
jgi:hypothetical protein